jgi:hypothetical protein
MRFGIGDQGVVEMAPAIVGVPELHFDRALADREPHAY